MQSSSQPTTTVQNTPGLTMSENNIIDLTVEDTDVIVVEDLDSVSLQRKSLSGSLNGSVPSLLSRISMPTDVDPQGSKGQGPSTRPKKSRRKKKTKKTAVTGAEEGEIIEVDSEDVTEQSRAQSFRKSLGGAGENEKEVVVVEDTEEEERQNATHVGRGVRGEVIEAGKQEIDTSLPARPSGKIVCQGREEKERDLDSDPEPSKSSSPKRKRERRQEDRDEDPLDDVTPPKDEDLFYVDTTPTGVIPPASKPAAILPATVTNGESKVHGFSALLLPAHVSIFELNQDGTDPIEILPPPPPDSEEEDYIDYLDYGDDRKAPGMVRYFDDVPVDADGIKTLKATRVVCKNCGAEGEHKTYECPVIICLTCGARDEHSTRSCPISKTCFNCGMKGHINRACPNRHTRRQALYDDCDRCGSRHHSTKECPSLWRIYNYVSDLEQQSILDIRAGKSELPIGEGGEGYIAREFWCYNCGGIGHLGDECMNVHHPADHPREPCAFSAYNTRSGPFFDPLAQPESEATSSRSKRRKDRSWNTDAWGDGHGSALPMDVGKQGRRKEQMRMAKRAAALEEDDEGDFFSRLGKGKAGDNRKSGSGSRNDRENDRKKITFGGFSGGDRSRYEHLDRSRDSDRRRDRDRDRGRDKGRDREIGKSSGHYDGLPLPSRETDSLNIKGAASRRDDDRYERDDRRERDRDWDRRRDRNRGRERERDRREMSPPRRPRYHGGYTG